MSDATGLMDGLISGNMSSAEFTAVLKDIEVKELDDYESVDDFSMEQYLYQAYMVEAEVVDQIYGDLPSKISYIAHRFKKKGYEKTEKPYIFSFCQTSKGTYFMPNVMTRLEASEESIGTAKQIAEVMKEGNVEVSCVTNSDYFKPKNY